jgi:hypothetical protein
LEQSALQPGDLLFVKVGDERVCVLSRDSGEGKVLVRQALTSDGNFDGYVTAEFFPFELESAVEKVTREYAEFKQVKAAADALKAKETPVTPIDVN